MADGVGRDNISDFTTNLILDFLCRYTEVFAAEYLRPADVCGRGGAQQGPFQLQDRDLGTIKNTMKRRDANPVGITKVDAKVPQVSSTLFPSVVTWLLHWVSALLVLFLLATSLASGLGITARFFPASWMDWHLSAGVALLAVSIVRLRTSRPFGGYGNIFAFSKLDAQAVKSALFLMVLVVVVSGLAIFQKPPFGRSGVLFGLFPMPTLIRLDHSIHYVIIDIHIALSCIIAVLLIAHIIVGLQRARAGGQSRLAIMLWPWRKG